PLGPRVERVTLSATRTPVCSVLVRCIAPCVRLHVPTHVSCKRLATRPDLTPPAGAVTVSPCAGAATAGTGTPAVLKQRHQFFASLRGAAGGAVVTLACYIAGAIRRMTIEGAWPASRANPDSWWDIVAPWVREPLLLVCVPVTLLAMWN